ncbi:LysE family translocator [Streptosporangium roseum]|uniref:LysE family efflux protein n=1 Tax=Streptosporangium roseum (strain ATCC 12428 / DSM 43021 / JCM 3005 / KCTC 9067 / NCIMB 10171 / NRRL 2505 / NI 9100) TaxID=479432 RepID=D2AWI7_STRRD|nr:LysE family translocator [Streptosporangium roseum]ACZ86983.1 LysE family efflux protein [Streptosporangium roseum DSM 43021]
MVASLLAFTVVALILTVSPGPDTVIVLRTTVSSGRRAGFLAGLGVNLGCYVWGVATALGLTALLAASDVAYTAVRIAGVAYLVWLGVRALWNARRAVPAEATEATEATGVAEAAGGTGGPPVRALAIMRTGFITNLLNPKVGVIYMTLLPQFVPADVPVLPATLLLVTIHNLLGAAWFALVVLAASLMRRSLSRPVVRRRMEQLTGLVFIGFGVRLAAESG